MNMNKYQEQWLTEKKKKTIQEPITKPARTNLLAEFSLYSLRVLFLLMVNINSCTIKIVKTHYQFCLLFLSLSYIHTVTATTNTYVHTKKKKTTYYITFVEIITEKFILHIIYKVTDSSHTAQSLQGFIIITICV